MLQFVAVTSYLVVCAPPSYDLLMHPCWSIALATLAACLSHAARPPAARMGYLIGDDSTLDGSASAGVSFEVTRYENRVFFVRSGGTSPLNEGFGVRAKDGSYEVVFHHSLRTDVELIILHGGGSGVRVFSNKRDTGVIRVKARGDELVLSGSGFDGAIVHLSPGGTGTLGEGASPPTHVVYGRFGGDVLIGVGWTGMPTEIAVGRYDFDRGHGENAGPHGAGTESFAARRSRTYQSTCCSRTPSACSAQRSPLNNDVCE